MNHPLHRVASFEIVGPYQLRVRFDDGVAQTIDFQPILVGELYGPLRAPEIFNQVKIDPATLHDWPEHLNAMKAHVKNWDSVPA